uniref:Uncharacterized protein n=1 Tax=Setaria digitata TaxID=48799 RepID=A0A915Q7L6_9BILA
MSNTQPSSGQSNGGGRLCYKRSHDNITDDSNSSSSSRQQRALVEDERQDFINYQKGKS